MSGLVKATQYDWKDSNLALFGSDVEKNVKKESAETEPAWKGAGRKVGIQIWRIVKFKVTDWPKENYGKFYNGDSYIILNTYKNPDQDVLLYDVHFWIGQHSTQDEYGTAAYKTVELDTFLDDKPVQHREVEGHESPMFKKYFSRIELLDGGADSGFHKVEPKKYKPRLIHVSGTKKNICMKQVPFIPKSLTKNDVFIIDCGLEIFQWNGVSSHMMEKYEAGKYIVHLRSLRGGSPTLEVLDDQEEQELSPELEEVFLAQEPYQTQEEDSTVGDDEEPPEKILFRLSDESGKIDYKVVAKGKAVNNRKMLLKSEDVFILDTGHHCYVWVGKAASGNEKKNGLGYAHMYLCSSKHPLVAISCFNEGSEPEDFSNSFK